MVSECEELFTKYSCEYENYHTSLTVAKLFASRSLSNMREWNVKEDPLFNYSKFYEIKEILSVGKTTSFGDDDNSFSDAEVPLNNKQISENRMKGDTNYKESDILYWLFDKYWLQPMRAYVSSKWQVKEDGATLAEAILKWSYLMPAKFLQKFVQMYLKPRLKREISDNWDPRNIKERVEKWLLPWRQVLGDKEMQGFFVIIKLKLTTALADWEP